MAYERDNRPYDRSGYDRDRYDGRDDRGFFERAGDEVRSWFGDEEAERRRRVDERYDERNDRAGRGYGAGDPSRGAAGYRSYERSNRDEGGDRGRYSGGRPYAAPYGQPEAGRQFDDDGAVGGQGYNIGGYGYDRGNDAGRRAAYRAAYQQRDAGRGQGGSWRDEDHHGYHDWRDRQISAFDRDYDEYRQENRSRFESEFATWRQNRQTQRDSLTSVKEHQEVVGSDGTHVGTVDHVRGDHLLLTKTDRDAGGHHHSIPSSWIVKVGDTVQLNKTADEAKRLWTDAERTGSLFGGERDQGRDGGREESRDTGGNLNRSFSGTY